MDPAQTILKSVTHRIRTADRDNPEVRVPEARDPEEGAAQPVVGEAPGLTGRAVVDPVEVVAVRLLHSRPRGYCI
jgi:hypothetical protein